MFQKHYYAPFCFANLMVCTYTAYVISDFVNTETTTEITGAKTFSSAVSVEDIFAVGTTLINDLSVAHMLHCFVDKNSALTDDIHIYHPVHYDSISVPRLEVLRNRNFMYRAFLKKVGLANLSHFVLLL